jgi:hypothetical protein
MKTTRTLFGILAITAAKENYMKKTWPILLGLLLLAAPRAEAQFSYTTNSDRVTLTITGYAGPPWAVTIPTNINGLTVTGIGEYAFADVSSLTSVTIPKCVTNIGNVPFVDCSSLEAITVDAQNAVYSSVNGVLFDKRQTTLIEYPAGKVGSYTIPSGVTSIGYGAFGDCAGLTNVTMPKTVTSIGGWAFQYCTSLTNVTIPGSVTSIGYAAFESCTSLTNVTIPKSLTSIMGDAFYDCESLSSVTIPGTVTSIGFEAFCYCYSLTNVTISKGVTSIGEYAFYDCEGLASVTIPSSVTSIGYEAFYGCEDLTSVTIPSRVTSIDYEAFAYCYSLTNLTISKGVTSIGEYAFYECKDLTDVTIPSSVTSIGYEAFSYCDSLASVCFEGSPPLDGYYVFSGEGIFQDDPLTSIFFVNGTDGWGSTYDGFPTEPCAKCGGAVLATLLVQTNGVGTITPKDNGALLAIGSNYTLTASPGKNWIFSNWVASGSESFVSNNPVLKFTMQPNLTLTVNFVTNVFLAAQGTPYHGLFAPTNAPRQQANSGAITFTVTSAGVLSGKLTIGANTPSLSGQFNPAGAATITTPRKGLSTLTTALQLDFAGQTATGSITDGSFVAQVMADLDVFNSTRKATNYEGQYTLIIPGITDSTVGPFGTSCGTVTVSPLGAITFAWSLADGTSVSPQSSVVSKDGYWPFYLPLYSGNGSLWSWNCFSNGAIISGTSASWINATNPTKNALYPTGFTNQAASIFGSAYNSTGKPLLALTNGEVILDGGNLPFTITNQFTLAPNNTITLTNAADTNKLTLTIKTAGVITGSFANPSNPKQAITLNGVLLQNETNAAGYFLGSNQSGTFMLMSQ